MSSVLEPIGQTFDEVFQASPSAVRISARAQVARVLDPFIFFLHAESLCSVIVVLVG